MKTKREFSTVWFGSPEWLKKTLEEFERMGKLTFWAFIKHHAEEDEKKDHFHVYMVPNGTIDTDTLTAEMTEYQLGNDKPVRPLPYKPSKFGDWYLYVTHNIPYLLSKGQSRKYHYTREDIICSNDDFLLELVHQIDFSKINRIEIVREAAENGVTFDSLVANGQIPIQLINQYQKAYNIMAYAVEQTVRRDTEIKGLVNRINEDPDITF